MSERDKALEEAAKVADGWEAGDRKLAAKANTTAASLHHEIAADMAHDIAASIRALIGKRSSALIGEALK